MLMGYPKDEMQRRRHVRDMLYSDAALDYETLTTMGNLKTDLYVIVRDDEDGLAGLTKFESYPDLFEIAHTVDAISVVKVNRRACRDLAAELGQSES